MNKDKKDSGGNWTSDNKLNQWRCEGNNKKTTNPQCRTKEGLCLFKLQHNGDELWRALECLDRQFEEQQQQLVVTRD
ncbi:hypothetical protein Pmani_015914 [Petrolisthes manimaculis]|uniref:Uncharacterized protein n=1 Tax=Petrolisthes manimaculis TaxID=1843537 RepID=A0AAE1UBK4_9EUCA|nr:hypothetical protein Pmani_015914 [Petrolisthes manimaculis]